MAADGFTLDLSEVHALTAALGEVAASAGPLVRDAMQRTAIDVKADWRAAASGHRSIRRYPFSIGYDFIAPQSAGGISTYRCDIGPDKSKKQGALGNLLEYGSPNSAPHHWGDRALEGRANQYQALVAAAIEHAESALANGGNVLP